MTVETTEYRDGVSRPQRAPRALAGDYVSVEERTTADWLHFVQQYAKMLKFYDTSNTASGDWSVFFGCAAVPDPNKSPEMVAADERQFVENLAAWMEDPQSVDPALQAAFSQPHHGLMGAFLHLLRHPRAMFEAFTNRHMDYYFRRVLGLENRPPRPDRVHVMFELDNEFEEHRVQAGTLVDGGKDASGEVRHYALDRELVVNTAQVVSLKTLAVKKEMLQDKERITAITAETTFHETEGVATDPKGFETFPDLSDEHVTSDIPQPVGLSITSPLLQLNEGRRVITLLFSCKAETFQSGELKEIIQVEPLPFEKHIRPLKARNQPFIITVSAGKKWIEPHLDSVLFGDFMAEDPLQTYTPADNLTLLKNGDVIKGVTADTANLFESEDYNRFLVLGEGEILRITRRVTPQQLDVVRVGRLDNHSGHPIRKFPAGSFFSNALRFQISLDQDHPPLTGPGDAEGNLTRASSFPVVNMALRDVDRFYRYFQDLELEKAHVRVDVEGLRKLALRNDDGVLSPRSPFMPFGHHPRPGSSLNIAHEEICSKKLTKIDLNVTWIGLPMDLGTHYQAYTDSPFVGDELSLTNTGFKGRLRLLNNRNWTNLDPDPVSLFDEENGKPSASRVFSHRGFPLPSYEKDLDVVGDLDYDPYDWDRYFKIELDTPDFQHDNYALVLQHYAVNENAPAVYPPVTPHIREITVDYQASVVIELQADFNVAQERNEHDRIIQLHPLGEVDMQDAYQLSSTREATYRMLPRFDHTGYFHMGLANVKTPLEVSLLLQMLEGSGNPDLEAPTIQWSYLSNDQWRDFKPVHVLSDETSGLLDPGIMRFLIPEDATAQNHLLPKGLHWLRACVAHNNGAVSKCLAVHAQTVSATFQEDNNHPDHLATPLPANAVAGLAVEQPEIQVVRQPYSSIGGKPAEDDQAWRLRVSERLRHKNRAINPWDYERLVLDHYHEIYKAKAFNGERLEGTDEAGNVTVVVIPDIAGRHPSFPLKPKASLHLLGKIQEHLESRCSPFVKLDVKNPYYQPITYRMAIRFHQGYDQGYYMDKLTEDLKRFLSPWAYGEQAALRFGAVIHASSVIHFMEQQPYVDYVAKVKLIEQVRETDPLSGEIVTRLRVDPDNIARAQRPDAVLVSAENHFVDVITTEPYDPSLFEGIGYMIVGIDNYLAQNQ